MQSKHVVLIFTVLLLSLSVYLLTRRKERIDLLSSFTGGGSELISKIQNKFGIIQTKVNGYLQEIENAANNAEYYYAPEYMKEHYKYGVYPITETFGPITEEFGIIQDIQGAVGSIGNVVSKVTELPGMAMGIVNTVEDKASGAFKKVKGIGSEVAGAVEGVVKDIQKVDYVGIAKDVGEKIEGAGEYVFDKVKDGAEFVYDNTKAGAQIAYGGVKTGLTTAYKEVKSIGTTVGEKLKDGFDYVGDGLKDIGEKGIDMVKTIGEKTVGVFGTIIDTVKDILFAVVRIIQGMVANARDMGPFLSKYGKIFKYALYILLLCLLLQSFFGLMYTLKGGVNGEVARFSR
jgi:hypothetical protein